MRWYLLICILVEVKSITISSQGRYFEREEHESVDLPCNVEGLDKETTVVWKKSQEIIFIDESNFLNDPRLRLGREHDNFTLTIEDLEPFDSSNYTCTITTTPERSIIHHVQVNVPPTISISPDFNPYIVKIGEDVVLNCLANGNPKPSVAWSREDPENLPQSAITRHNSLQIFNVSVADTGIYVCTASNKISDVYDSIKVLVQEETSKRHAETPPWASTDYSYLPVEVDRPVNISCKYDGEPVPEVTWFFNAFIINDATDVKFKGITRYAVRNSNYSETIIKIPSVNEDHFGDYMCRISNKFGTASKMVHVSGRPGPPSLELSGSTLSWKLQSVNPIIMYKIKYRAPHDDTWRQSFEIRAKKEDQKGTWWSSSSDLSWLPKGSDYELQLQARNSLGWGSLARSYIRYNTTIPTPKTEAKRGGCGAQFRLRAFAWTSIPLYFAAKLLLIGFF